MERKLKTISRAGIKEALAKVELYRFLNEPEEAESICQDVLAIEPENELALRLLGLTITDQFTGAAGDRYGEVERIFESLPSPYERHYYLGLLCERRAKAQLRAGRPAHSLVVLFERAMNHFEEAERIRPAGNDDSILRWNRCARLLESIAGVARPEHVELLDAGDSRPY
jgi:tetratricopeptide (TPR) repeat protein